METNKTPEWWRLSIDKIKLAGAEYSSAVPFPHVVVDDLLPSDLCSQVASELIEYQCVWTKSNNARETKLFTQQGILDRLRANGKIPHVCSVLEFLASVELCEAISSVTGIEEILPDSYFVGGGIHRINRGGRLAVHTDFTGLPGSRGSVFRRANALLYMNENWDETYGGHLHLVDGESGEVARSILPIANRFVLFDTTTKSWHGHPVPLTCPSDRARLSLASYYYTHKPPHDFIRHQNTTFLERKIWEPNNHLKT